MFFFFFKQKTAYEMRISDWSSDVCSSDLTLARAFDYVQQIKKTPIVVNDSRGFYTSRVFATYVMEGLAALLDGVHPRSIEVAGLQAGMPEIGRAHVELQSLMRISYAVFCLKKKKKTITQLLTYRILHDQQV